MAKNKEKVNYKLPTKNIWFKDQVEPDPDEDRDKFIAYWKREKLRCINGFKIADDQVYIPGWLYWHTVYWTIELDQKFINPITNKEDSYKVPGIPVFRDIEWEVAMELNLCETLKRHYNLIGARGFGKSMICSSYIGHGYSFFKNSELLITGGNHPDIDKLAEKIDLGLANIHPCFRLQRIKNNWKLEVRSGWEDKATGLPKGPNSRIIRRNYDNGNKTMATNGTRPKRQIIDEAGKIPNLRACLNDSIPSWKNDHGVFCTMILTGTGGDMEVGEEAGIIFNNPDLYNFLSFETPTQAHRIGKFMPVTKARNEYKDDWTLFKYLKDKFPEQYENLQYHPDLDIIIKVSDEERCVKEFCIPERELAAKASSSNELIKHKAYYPLTPEECFLTVSANDFPIEMAKEQLVFLDTVDFKPQRIELFTDLTGNINFKHSDRMPVTDFPVTSKTKNKQGVIEMIEQPIVNAAHGLYVCGIDPYKIAESDYSTSVGSIVIMKRMTTNLSEPFQYMPVAWYHGRPKQIKEWYETVRLLIEWYNASAMCENIDGGFIDYMIGLNKQHYLARGQSYLKEIAPSSKHKGEYGLPPTPKIIEHWLNKGIEYCNELFSRVTLETGETKQQFGTSRILDRMLLTEIIKFNKNSGNFDRLRAFCIAVAYAKQLDGMIGKIQIEEEYRERTKIIKSPFGLNKVGFSNKFGSKVSSPFLINKFK